MSVREMIPHESCRRFEKNNQVGVKNKLMISTEE